LNEVWRSARFYWSVLDGFDGLRPGSVPQGVLAIFEDEVPVPVEELWTIGAPSGDGRLILCAVPRSELGSLDPGAMSLTPDSIPGFADLDPSLFNLLVGDFEPVHLRRARRRRHAAFAGTVVMCVCLLGIGFSRRAAAWNEEAAQARQESKDLVASVSPSGLWTKDDLAMEVMKKRGEIHTDFKPPGDAALALSSVMSHWPTDVPAKALGIAATGDSASLSVTVPGEPGMFLSALKAPAGWRMDEPRLTAIESATRLSLEFRRTEP